MQRKRNNNKVINNKIKKKSMAKSKFLQNFLFLIIIIFCELFQREITTALHCAESSFLKNSNPLSRPKTKLFSTKLESNNEELLFLSALVGDSTFARKLQRFPILYQYNQLKKADEGINLLVFAQQRRIVQLIIQNKHKKAEQLLENYERKNVDKGYASYGTVTRKVLDTLPSFQITSSRADVSFYYQAYERLAEANIFRTFGTIDVGDIAPVPISNEQLETSAGAPISKLIPSNWPFYLWFGTLLSIFSTGMIAGRLFHVNTILLCFWVPFFMIVDQVWSNGIAWETLVLQAQPNLKERALYHEAGHFLVAYLLGYPVSRYFLTPLQSLKTGFVDKGSTVFFTKDEWSRKRLGGLHPSNEEVNQLSVILMAGIAAELLMFGDVQGGSADEKMLASLFKNGWVPSGSISDEPISDQTRWALIEALKLLQLNLTAFLSLAKAMRKQKGVAECILKYENELKMAESRQ